MYFFLLWGCLRRKIKNCLGRFQNWFTSSRSSQNCNQFSRVEAATDVVQQLQFFPVLLYVITNILKHHSNFLWTKCVSRFYLTFGQFFPEFQRLKVLVRKFFFSLIFRILLLRFCSQQLVPCLKFLCLDKCLLISFHCFIFQVQRFLTSKLISMGFVIWRCIWRFWNITRLIRIFILPWFSLLSMNLI